MNSIKYTCKKCSMFITDEQYARSSFVWMACRKGGSHEFDQKPVDFDKKQQAILDSVEIHVGWGKRR